MQRGDVTANHDLGRSRQLERIAARGGLVRAIRTARNTTAANALSQRGVDTAEIGARCHATTY